MFGVLKIAEAGFAANMLPAVPLGTAAAAAKPPPDANEANPPEAGDFIPVLGVPGPKAAVGLPSPPG